MRKNFVLLMLSLFIVPGCGPKVVKTETKMYQLFERDFEQFAASGIDKIKEGERRSFPHVEFDEVWDSVISVLMQQGVVLRSAKESGVIVGMGSVPLSIFIERREPVNVYVNIMLDIYKTSDELERAVIEFKSSKLNRISENFLDQLATQVYAEKKWKYLYINER